METDHAAACRYFTPGDACRVALDAYRTAAANLTPPAGEPWMLGGQPFASSADFADDFVAELVARLGLLALDRLGTFAPPEDRGNPWERARLAAPEKMRPIIADRETELRQDEAEFLGDALHGLPSAENGVHNRLIARASDER